MHRDLLDALRCPRDHDEGWLVAMVHDADGPQLREADLACPMCGADYAVRQGVLTFAPPPERLAPPEPPDPLRTAALLSASPGPWPILLTGAYTLAGDVLLDLVDAPQLWIDPPETLRAHARVACDPRVSVIVGAPWLPLGVSTIAAAAIDRAHTDAAWLASVRRAVRVGGRVVASADIPLPADVRELARDGAEWVAEVTTAAGGLVELRRRA